MLTARTGISSYSPPPDLTPITGRALRLEGEVVTSESDLEGEGRRSETPVRLATGQKDTSMRLTIRRQTSKLKPFDLKLLTVREGRGRRKEWMSTVGTRWGGDEL